MATETQIRVAQLLDKLVADPGLRAASLVTRDGLAVVERGARLAGAETFSAMVAALAGAAETALIEAGSEGASRIRVDSTRSRLYVSGVNDQMLLVTLVDPSLPLKDAEARIEAALGGMREILGR